MVGNVKKILILGGESSGKTTLTIELAKHLRVPAVLEYGREFCEKVGNELELGHMLHIATEHVSREDFALHYAEQQNLPYIVCDTSALTTHWYSREFFGGTEYPLIYLSNESFRRYDFVFICDNSIPFEQDGTRVDEVFRRRAYEWYIEKHETKKVPYTILTGSVHERIQTVMKVLDIESWS